jgi:hypothetical protein
MKIRPGNKWNSWLNGEWATHAKAFGKKKTSSRRRQWSKRVLKEELRLAIEG